MSKRLGLNYLTPAMEKYHKQDLSRTYVVTPEGYKMALPRYYQKKLYDSDDRMHQRIVMEEEREKARLARIRRVNLLYKGRVTIENHEFSERAGRFHRDQLKQNDRLL